MLLTLAWRNIWRNKRRSLITGASVSFALFFAIVLRSLQLGTYAHAYNGVINATTGFLQIHEEGYWDQPTLDRSLLLNDSLRQAVQSTEEASDWLGRLESFSLLSGPSGNTRGGLLRGLDPAAEQQHFGLTDKLVAGRFFEEGEAAVVLGRRLADALNLSVGDTLIVIGQGYHGISANARYPVVGLVDLGNPEMDKRAVLMSLEEARYLLGAEERLTALVIIPEDSDELIELKEQLLARIDPEKYEVMTWREMMPELIQAIEADSAGGLIILFILYMVVSFGVFGTILMLTAERLPEFGILISIGMSRLRVVLITLLETVFLTVLGVLAGSLLALPIAWYFHLNPIRLTGEFTAAMEEYGFEPVIPLSVDPAIWLTHGSGILIISLLLSSYALISIYRLKPIEAMHR